MKIKFSNSYLIVATAFSLLLSVTPIYAATINFTGILGFIEIDNGTSMYSGTSIGDTFSGSITYGNSVSDASSIDIVSPISADYIFTGVPYGGVVTDGSITATGINSLVGIGDNDSMGDDASIINNLYGAGSTTITTIADTWTVDSFNGLGLPIFGMVAYSLDTSLYSGLDFQIAPPALYNADFVLFLIAESDALGNTTYLATGKLTSVAVVPIPATLWLFVSGVIGIFGFSRQKTAVDEG